MVTVAAGAPVLRVGNGTSRARPGGELNAGTSRARPGAGAAAAAAVAVAVAAAAAAAVAAVTAAAVASAWYCPPPTKPGGPRVRDRLASEPPGASLPALISSRDRRNRPDGTPFWADWLLGAATTVPARRDYGHER